jgi:hypothetical protein
MLLLGTPGERLPAVRHVRDVHAVPAAVRLPAALPGASGAGEQGARAHRVQLAPAGLPGSQERLRLKVPQPGVVRARPRSA